MSARRSFVSIALGVLFGIGLTLSGMIQPKRIQDFLDVMTMGFHRLSPEAASMKAFKRARARFSVTATVPRDVPRICAISASL